jgi:hypothetical protein
MSYSDLNVPSLPLPIMHLQDFGRGTAGCVVELSAGNNPMSAVLTNAHVVSVSLQNCGNRECSPEEINEYNKHCDFDSYVRDPDNGDLDYVFVQLRHTVVYFQPRESIFEFQRSNFKFCNGNLIIDAWNYYRGTGVFLRDMIVYKRGIATGITQGQIKDIKRNGIIVIQSKADLGKEINIDNYRFSMPGDRGSLVFLKEDDMLVPFALHYSADVDSDCSYCIPLWYIFLDFCRKNNLQKLSLRFVSPCITTLLKFDTSKFDSTRGLTASGETTEAENSPVPSMIAPSTDPNALFSNISDGF